MKDMTDEQRAELIKNVYSYIWNIMGLGEYSEDELNKIKEENKTKDIFTNFTDDMKILNLEHLFRGYGNFGREFLEKVYDQDRASTINMFEAVTQELLDLNAAVAESTKALEAQLAEKIKEAEQTKETN